MTGNGHEPQYTLPQWMQVKPLPPCERAHIWVAGSYTYFLIVCAARPITAQEGMLLWAERFEALFPHLTSADDIPKDQFAQSMAQVAVPGEALVACMRLPHRS